MTRCPKTMLLDLAGAAIEALFVNFNDLGPRDYGSQFNPTVFRGELATKYLMKPSCKLFLGLGVTFGRRQKKWSMLSERIW